MRKRLLTIEELNSLERASVLSFLREAHSLFLATAPNMHFNEWLDLLTTELHNAVNLQISKKKS